MRGKASTGQCGDHVIYCEDCLHTMSERIEPGSVDLVVTSPPYDDLREYNGFNLDVQRVIEGLLLVVKDGGVVVWIVADGHRDGGETGTSFRHALAFLDAGFTLIDTMIWDKESFSAVGAIRSRYPQSFEYMFIFSKGRGHTFNRIDDRKNKYCGGLTGASIRLANGDMRVTKRKRIREFGPRFNVWRNTAVRGLEVGSHPAPFPVKLARDHIVSWSNPGEMVYDPFSGSGTTGVAAKNESRKFVGSEISIEYAQKAQSRIDYILL